MPSGARRHGPRPRGGPRAPPLQPRGRRGGPRLARGPLRSLHAAHSVDASPAFPLLPSRRGNGGVWGGLSCLLFRAEQPNSSPAPETAPQPARGQADANAAHLLEYQAGRGGGCPRRAFFETFSRRGAHSASPRSGAAASLRSRSASHSHRPLRAPVSVVDALRALAPRRLGPFGAARPVVSSRVDPSSPNPRPRSLHPRSRLHGLHRKLFADRAQVLPTAAPG